MNLWKSLTRNREAEMTDAELIAELRSHAIQNWYTLSEALARIIEHQSKENTP